MERLYTHAGKRPRSSFESWKHKSVRPCDFTPDRYLIEMSKYGEQTP